jgi:hypothetical protein
MDGLLLLRYHLATPRKYSGDVNDVLSDVTHVCPIAAGAVDKETQEHESRCSAKEKEEGLRHFVANQIS